MEIIFKEYKETDFKDLALCMERLQDYVVVIDPLKRLHRLKNKGEFYTNNLIKKINKGNGRIILAYDKKKIIGCIAGIIEKHTKDDLLECIPSKIGRILELFVSGDYRGHDIGKKLMTKMEDYFKEKKCDTLRVEVFVPNQGAHSFYKKLGYHDRMVDMIKPIK
ncbi:MAG: GNAT family N-acetyltransferase [Candidatus ainarchaeum sp.]|nr:GNAT family N-acetyltransferase [Candidatus ainarchaeum sp.]